MALIFHQETICKVHGKQIHKKTMRAASLSNPSDSHGH